MPIDVPAQLLSLRNEFFQFADQSIQLQACLRSWDYIRELHADASTGEERYKVKVGLRALRGDLLQRCAISAKSMDDALRFDRACQWAGSILPHLQASQVFPRDGGIAREILDIEQAHDRWCNLVVCRETHRVKRASDLGPLSIFIANFGLASLGTVDRLIQAVNEVQSIDLPGRLTRSPRAVLEVLNKAKRLLTQPEIAARITEAEPQAAEGIRRIGGICQELEGKGWINRPNGRNNGYEITDLGRKQL